MTRLGRIPQLLGVLTLDAIERWTGKEEKVAH